MNQALDISAGSTIEAAMARIGGTERSEGRTSACHVSAPTPEGDSALARRLGQLHAAMGSEKHPSPAPGSARVAGAARHRIGLVVAVLVISGLSGTAVMRSMSDGGNPVPLLAPPSAIATPARSVGQAPLASEHPATDSTANADEREALDLLEAWRQAWSSRNAEAYLNCYSPDFTPAGGGSHAEWVASRKKKLSSPAEINVQVRQLRAERLSDNRIKLLFLQDYASETYREAARPKMLMLTRFEDGWRITDEWQGSH